MHKQLRLPQLVVILPIGPIEVPVNFDAKHFWYRRRQYSARLVVSMNDGQDMRYINLERTGRTRNTHYV